MVKYVSLCVCVYGVGTLSRGKVHMHVNSALGRINLDLTLRLGR